MTTPDLLYRCYRYLDRAAQEGKLQEANERITGLLKKQGVPLNWLTKEVPPQPYIIPAVPYAPPPKKKK